MSRLCDLEQQVEELQNQLNNLTPAEDCCTKRIWRYKPPVESGLRARWWLAEAGPHLDPLEWTGPADYNGFPLPTAAAPNTDVVNNFGSVNDANSGAGASRYGIIHGWIWLPNNVTHWRDANGNSGELGMLLSGSCCGGALVERPGGNHDANTNAVDRTLMDSNPITGGWHYIYSPQSDLSAFGGLQLQYSTDNEATWLAVSVKQPNRLEIEGMDIPCCDDIPEGWSADPLQFCCQPQYLNGAGGQA